jgi:RNA polymerase sigma-70 factor (ECF subfamily)
VGAPRDEWLIGFDEDLAAALAGLPDQQRAVIEMRVLDGRPYAEVAEGLAITPGAARVRAHRGLSTLRAALGTPRNAVASTSVPPEETIR